MLNIVHVTYNLILPVAYHKAGSNSIFKIMKLRHRKLNILTNAPPKYIFNIFFFLFYTGVSLINNTELVLGIQKDIQLYICVYIFFFKFFFSFRLLQNIDESSFCYTVSPPYLSILNMCVSLASLSEIATAILVLVTMGHLSLSFKKTFTYFSLNNRSLVCHGNSSANSNVTMV